MSLVGSLSLTISGAALATLSAEQLRALRPNAREPREQDPPGRSRASSYRRTILQRTTAG